MERKTYINDSRFGKDYERIHKFLFNLNNEGLISPGFGWGRWAWMISRPTDFEDKRNEITYWEDKQEIVALATFEDELGRVYIIIKPDYEFLYAEILEYCRLHFMTEDGLYVIIDDNKHGRQRIASEMGFYPTRGKEPVAYLMLDKDFEIEIKPGYEIISMDQNWDFKQYNNVMWKGFGHEGEADQSEEELLFRKTMLSSPHLNKTLVVAMVDETNEYVAHAGLWYENNEFSAYLEPVATIPRARKKGLAKACIYEILNRARSSGAKMAIVGSDQQFYYKIGFMPYTTFTWWYYKI